MRRTLPFIIVIAVAIAAVVSGTLLYRAKKPAALSETSAGSTSTTGHMRGNANAPNTLEEYGDYQCPPCGKLAEPLKKMEHDYGDRILVVFHQFPLDVHAHAREAARAAEAAGLQGKFWEMHDVLYREQSAWSGPGVAAPQIFTNYATMLGLDVEKFTRDFDSDKVKKIIDEDQAAATARGVQVTPSVFINNKYVVPQGDDPTKTLREAIDAALKSRTGS